MAKKKSKPAKKAGKKKSSAKKRTVKAKAKKLKRASAKKAKVRKMKPKKVRKVVARRVSKKVAGKKPVPKRKIAKKAGKKAVKKPHAKKVPVRKAPVVRPAKEEVKAQASLVQQEAAHSGGHSESFVPHVTSLKAGDAAPYFRGLDQHGNSVSSDDFPGKTIVLYFYPKDDTEGCTAESCSLRDEYQYLASRDHVVIGVSADDVDSHKHFADKYNLPFPLIADTDMSIIKAYDVWGRKRLFDHIYDGIVRTTFLIKDGRIERVITAVDTKNHGKQVMEA